MFNLFYLIQKRNNAYYRLIISSHEASFVTFNITEFAQWSSRGLGEQPWSRG